MAEINTRIELSSMPDGYGFIYGQAWRGEQHFNINVLPPVSQWSGQMRLPNYEPHATDWILYVDGEEIARVSEREAVEDMFQKALPKR
ncbi:MAG: hypothetical protein APF80_12440 [Alphaproteobacteria bacterium BRH_c36]|nr:MAG: hypothetical protein APF80_12440 [Alphaproteobacteria bacterium BRH_c36]